MVVKRKISKDKYILAGFLTFLIFSLGISLGIIIDNARANWAKYENNVLELDYQSLQYQSLFLNSLEEEGKGCAALHSNLEKSVAQLGESLELVLTYQEDSKINKKAFQLVQRRYLLDNIRYWLFAKKSKQECQIDLVTVLYFYSEQFCAPCPTQGTILTYYKNIFDERVLIFPINVDLRDEEPLIGILMDTYKVNRFPSLLIEDTLFEGVITKKKLGTIICDSFIRHQKECRVA